MCHHKAPHRSFEPHPRYRHLYADGNLPVPETFWDDYANRAAAAAAAKMRISSDMTYKDLGLVQPEGGEEVGERLTRLESTARSRDRRGPGSRALSTRRPARTISSPIAMKLALLQVPALHDATICRRRLDRRQCRTPARLSRREGLAENTIVIYTSDQGFFLGEHGWFDKRFMYEESLQMPFLIRYPAASSPATISDRIATNVDFAPTFLDYAGVRIPTYMQGTSLRPLLDQTVGGTGRTLPITATGCTRIASTTPLHTMACATAATS